MSARILGNWYRPSDEQGCLLWLRADLGVTLVSGDCSQWLDQISGIAFTQATASKRPTYNATGIGGQPSLTFDGTADGLISTSTITATSDLLIVAACNPATTALNQLLLDSQTGRLILAVPRDTLNEVAYYDSAWRTTGAASTTGAQVLTWSLVAPSAGAVYRNGTALGTGLSYTQRALSSSTSIGAIFNATSGFWGGNLAEIVICAAPNTAKRQRIERYMGNRYGIAVA